MAETNALLKRHTGNRIEGSNPSVSASSKFFNDPPFPKTGVFAEENNPPTSIHVR